MDVAEECAAYFLVVITASLEKAEPILANEVLIDPASPGTCRVGSAKGAVLKAGMTVWATPLVLGPEHAATSVKTGMIRRRRRMGRTIQI